MSKARAKTPAYDELVTHFINVDLDVYSAEDLQPLAEAFGNSVSVMHVGRFRRTYDAHFELARFRKNEDADRVIRDFCKLVASLPAGAKRRWRRAKRKAFNIGIQAGLQPKGWRTDITPETLAAAAKLGARIEIMVYSHTVFEPGAVTDATRVASSDRQRR